MLRRDPLLHALTGRALTEHEPTARYVTQVTGGFDAGIRWAAIRECDVQAWTCLIRNTNGSPGSADLVVNEGLANDHRRDTEAEPNPFLFTTSVFYNFSALSSDTLAVAGLITDNRVASVAIGGAGRRPVTARGVNGTFVVPGVRLNDGAVPQSVTIADRAGNTLASVPLNGTEEVIPTPSGR